jgi:DNA-binding ferritin-like protein
MELYGFKTITEDSEKPTTVEQMLINIGAANMQVIESLNRLFKDASAADEQGLVDFAAGRINIHKKYGWMIKSFLKNGE